jgi:hypothetical protein
MFRRLLYASVCVQALMLGSLVVAEINRAIVTPFEMPEDVPSTPNRLQLLVSAGSTSLSSTASASAMSTASGMASILANVERARIVDTLTGNQYDWPAFDHRERPAERIDIRSLSFDPRSWRGMATGEAPKITLDVSSGSAWRLGYPADERSGIPFGFTRIDIRST